jgi:hypothetical protein
VAVVTAGTRDASGVTFAIRIDAAAKAFPQLQGWVLASATPSDPAAPPAAPRQEPTTPAEVARTEPEPRAPEVSQLAGEDGAGRPRVAARAAAPAMVTVWEAPRPARRAAHRAAPPHRAMVPSHGDAVEPPPAQPAQAGYPLALAIALAALALGAGAIAVRAAAGSPPP